MPGRRITTNGADLPNIPLRMLRDRIRECIALRGTSAREASIQAGLGETYIHDLLSGKSNNPRMAALESVAQVLSCDLNYLLGRSDTITAHEGRRSIHPVPVMGVAEQGAFRPMLARSRKSETRTINAEFSPSYPHARHFAIEVRDDAMDRAGILSGMTALCIDIASANLTVESGRIYAIRRTFDAGKTFETTIKRAMVYADRTEYRPESNNPDHVPLVVAAGSHTDDQDAQVEPIALVYGTQQIFY